MLFLKDIIEQRKLQGSLSIAQASRPVQEESNESSNDYFESTPTQVLTEENSQTFAAPATMPGGSNPPHTDKNKKKRKISNSEDDPFLKIEKQKLKIICGKFCSERR